MGGACGTYGEEDTYRVLVGKTEMKRQLGRPRRRWEDNIYGKWDRGRDWIDLAQDRDRWWAVVNAVVSLLVP